MDESKLKTCSTHAEATDEATDPLEKDRRELDESETEVNSRKKQKQEEETAEKKKKCCFGTKDAKGNDDHFTIFVTGYDTSGSRDEIRSALVKHFSSCGKLTRVFVPIECKTGVSRGHAFINLTKRVDVDAALTLDGSHLGGRKLLVTMAKGKPDYYYYSNFKGCEICRAMFAAGRVSMYRWNLRTGCGKFTRFSPEFREKIRLRKKEKIEKAKRERETIWRRLKPTTANIPDYLYVLVTM